jgi:hypothetical protein
LIKSVLMAVQDFGHTSQEDLETALRENPSLVKAFKAIQAMREEERRYAELMEMQRLDETFVSDLAIGLGLFLIALVCFYYRVPVIGNAVALLVGPVIGLCLTLKHRRPR